jgi:hypothetical protein
MKIKLNTIKFILKFIIVIVLVGIFIYFLYKIITDNLIEGFSPYDCNDCKMDPTSGDCFKIYDFSYESNFQGMKIIDTSFIFCPWQPNCLPGLSSQEIRSGMTEEEISYNQAFISNTCCSGSTFYDNYTDVYEKFFKYTDIETSCENLISKFGELDKNADDYEIAMTNLAGTSQSLPYPLKICELNKSNKEKKGMIFKEITDGEEYPVFLSDNMKPSEILNYIRINYIDIDNDNPEVSLSFELILQELNDYAEFSDNLVTSEDIDRINEIKSDLYHDFSISSIMDICYQYQVYSTSGQDATQTKSVTDTNIYLLNENQFYSCSGEIFDQQLFDDMSFTQSDLDDFNNNDYFGDSSLNTFEDEEVRFYETENDFQMQLKNLPDLDQSTMAPVSVINQYMTSINSFYEKQMANMMGPKTHSVNDTLQFDNGTLESQQSTFFSYNDEPNNQYECENSITGNSIFDYCGPQPYTDYNPIQ